MALVKHLVGTRYFLSLGDSKSSNLSSCWQYDLYTYAEGKHVCLWSDLGPISTTGWYVHDLKTNIDARLALITSTPAPEFALINIGVNDAAVLPTEATFKSDFLYVLDALHAKWSSLPCYLAHVFCDTNDAREVNCATVNIWIDYVINQRAFAHAGIDETSFLTGANLTADKVHPSIQGYTETARQWWVVVLGN